MGRQPEAPLRKPILISVLVSGLLLVLTGFLSLTMGWEVQANQRSSAVAAAASLRGASDQYASRRALALRATVAFFDSSDRVEQREFERFAARITRAVPAVRSLNFIDPDLTIRWVVPLAGNEKIVNLSMRGLTGERLARLSARTGKLAVSDPIDLVEGGRGFLMMLPIQGGGTLMGYIEAVNQLERYVEALQLPSLDRRYGVLLTDSQGAVLYGEAMPGEPVVREALPIGDRIWQLSLWPRTTWWDHLPVILVWLVGILLWSGTMSLIWGDWFSSRRLGREVAARTSELAASRDQLAIILDGVEDAIVAWTPEQRLAYANPAARRLFSLADGEGMDWDRARRAFGSELLDDASEGPVPNEALATQRALRGEPVHGQALRYRTSPEAEERMIMVSASPVIENGEVQLVITIYHDLTERIRLENQLKGQVEELKQVDRLKSEFLSVVTHELRTPLTSIKGYAEFLEDEIGGPLTPEQGDFVRQLQFSADQLETLVDDLLDLARLEAGHFTLRVAPVDAAAIVKQVAETFQPQAREEKLELVVKVPDRQVPIQADARRLIQVLNNLMSNALKFTPSGGHVCLTLIEAEDQVRFEVTDTGIGVAPEHQGKLFTKFFQVDGALNRAYKGTGLGLPITKGLVEAHGGRVEVASEPGEGTTFTVVLPRRQGAGATPDAVEAE